MKIINIIFCATLAINSGQLCYAFSPTFVDIYSNGNTDILLAVEENKSYTLLGYGGSINNHADCVLKSKGKVHKDMLMGYLYSIDTAVYSYTIETPKSYQFSAKLNSADKNIEIISSDISKFCGIYTVFIGKYNKVTYRNELINKKNNFISLIEESKDNKYISDILSSAFITLGILSKKSYLYKSPNKKTKMYLIKGDKVTLLDEKTDDTGQKWYYINYKGKKDLNMWIKAEAVDLEPKAKESEKAEPVTEAPTSKPTEVAQQTLDTNAPKNTEVITPKKAEPIKTAKGSSSFALLASLFGLLSLRLKNTL